MRLLLRTTPFVALIVIVAGARPQSQAAGVAPESVSFAVIGDMGTGSREQIEVGRMMAQVRTERFPFSFVLTVGDNMYGGQRPSDFQSKFVQPYKALIDARVPFYASIGNHDEDVQLTYPLFNMGGRRYYTFSKGDVQFFALDSGGMNNDELRWFREELVQSTAPWKIAYMHHPMYSSGLRHGSSIGLRNVVEPLLTKYRVQVVFAGHDHFYERYAPKNGVQHFVTGAGGQLRVGNIQRTKDTAAGFDTDNSFMVARVRGDELQFQAISRQGVVVDSGVIDRLTGIRRQTRGPTSPSNVPWIDCGKTSGTAPACSSVFLASLPAH